MKKTKLKYFLFFFLSVFAVACSSQDVSSPAPARSDAGYVSGVQAGDFAPGQLEAHYLKHGNQFGNISQEEYLENARALLNAAPSNDILEKTRSDGDILRYRVSTGEFGVIARNGRILTYFKADYRYWQRQ